MDAKLFPFVKLMQAIPGAVEERQRIAAIAIGYACACNIPLPTSEVEDVATYYKLNVEQPIKRVISRLNEAALIDTSLALDFTRKFWSLRYDAVHKCPRMETIPGNFFCSVFGVAQYFSPELVEFADKHAPAINNVYQRVCGIIQEYLRPEVE